MALVLGKKNTRKIKVIAEQYGDFDEIVARHSFNIEFKIMPHADWLDAVNTEAPLADLAKENMVSVDGVTDENGNAIAYTAEIKEALFNETWLVKYLNEAFMTVQGGAKQTDNYKQAKRKN